MKTHLKHIGKIDNINRSNNMSPLRNNQCSEHFWRLYFSPSNFTIKLVNQQCFRKKKTSLANLLLSHEHIQKNVFEVWRDDAKKSTIPCPIQYFRVSTAGVIKTRASQRFCNFNLEFFTKLSQGLDVRYSRACCKIFWQQVCNLLI